MWSRPLIAVALSFVIGCGGCAPDYFRKAALITPVQQKGSLTTIPLPGNNSVQRFDFSPQRMADSSPFTWYVTASYLLKVTAESSKATNHGYFASLANIGNITLNMNNGPLGTPITVLCNAALARGIELKFLITYSDQTTSSGMSTDLGRYVFEIPVKANRAISAIRIDAPDVPEGTSWQLGDCEVDVQLNVPQSAPPPPTR